MKNKDLYKIIQNLNEVKDLKGVKLAFNILKNKKKIEEEISIIEQVIKPKTGYESYEYERIKLCEIHSEKDIDNNPIIKDNNYIIIDESKFASELNSLKEKYKDDINDRINQINEYNKLLEEESTIELSKVEFDDLPIDISVNELDMLSFMVNS